MTREEAIKKLKSQRNVTCNGCLHAVGWCESHCKFSEAIDMAIEALKQQEIIRCSDCEYCTEASLLSTPKPVNWCTQWVMKTESDWYCSRAERKADK